MPTAAIDHDHQIRTLLRNHLQPTLTGNERLLDELLLAWGDARADLALVGDRLEGFEIKAGKDTLKRLPAQVAAYDAVFERCWLVTTAQHLKEARALLPSTWGLLVAGGATAEPTLRRVRNAKPSKKRLNHHLVRLLWRDEMLAKLAELGLARGLRSKPKLVLYDILASSLATPDLASYVSDCLRTREDWRLD